MIFILYLTIGLLGVGTWFPKVFISFVRRDFPGSDWTHTDTAALIFATDMAILAWPLVAVIVFLYFTVVKALHPLIKTYFDEAERSNDEGKNRP